MVFETSKHVPKTENSGVVKIIVTFVLPGPLGLITRIKELEETIRKNKIPRTLNPHLSI